VGAVASRHGRFLEWAVPVPYLILFSLTSYILASIDLFEPSIPAHGACMPPFPPRYSNIPFSRTFYLYVFRRILTSCNVHIPYDRPLERMTFWKRGRVNGIWYIFLWWIHCLIVCTVRMSVQNQPASSRNHSFHWKRPIKDIISASVVFPIRLLTVVDSRRTLHIIRFIRDRWNRPTPPRRFLDCKLYNQ
jgi:hypothetical protein